MYTMRLSDLIEARGGHTTIDDAGLRILDKPSILHLDKYPIFDEAHRPILNSLILDTYWNREIAHETADIFIGQMRMTLQRIMPTYKVMVDLRLIDSYAGLIWPLIASATATLLFRQFFMTIPNELFEAARVDGAGPWRFFKDILLPLSRTNIAALFVILFIYGWTQYLWPLIVTNRNDMNTIVIALRKMISFADADTEWHLVMVTCMLAIIPPIIVVVLMQRWFVKGLVETEK